MKRSEEKVVGNYCDYWKPKEFARYLGWTVEKLYRYLRISAKEKQ